MTDIELARVPPIVDLTLYAGDGVSIRFTLTNNSAPYPLDGAVTSQIKRKRSDESPLVTWTVDDSSFSTGVVILSLTSEQTASLVSNGKNFRGVWDLQYTPVGAQPITLIQGRVRCDADVTR